MKKTITFFKSLLLAVILLVVGNEHVYAQSTYNLVTSSSDLVAGAKYLVVGLNTATYYAIGPQATNNRTGISVTVSSNTISVTPASSTTDSKPFELTLGGTSGSWTLSDAVNSSILGPAKGSAKSNFLKANTSGTPTYTIAIGSVTPYAATITCVGTERNTDGTGRNIIRFNYNSGSPLFASYASGQTDVYLYKLATPISAPTTQASDINFPSVDQNVITASWTNGDGAKRVVKMNTSNSFTDPTDGTDPTANTVYGGSGEQVVYNGTGTSVAVTGLTASTTYYFRAYEYNGSGSTTKYLTTTGTNNPNSQLTNSATSPIVTIAGTINAFANTVMNTTSGEQSYTVLGANLTDNVVITPPAGFEISKTSGFGFVANPSTLTFTSAEVASAQNVYVRFAPTAVQAYSGNITHTSTGATQVDKAVSGTGVYAEPTDQPTGLTATVNSSSQITVTWIDASGVQVPAGYIVKAAIDPSSPTAPVDGTAEADATFVKNIAQGTPQAVFTGLNASTTYNFSIWPYTNSAAAINYKTDGTVATASATTSILLVTAATVTLRPSHIDLSSTTSESAVLMTLTNYSSNDAKYRLYSTSQYSCWDEATDAYISSSTYSDGPKVPGTPITSATFWIVFQRGNNNSATATYRDRLGAAYTSNYQTVALPSATSISSGFTLSGAFVGTQTYNNSVKHVVLAYNGATLVSASSTTLSTGAFAVVCPTGTTIDKIEIRAIDNTLIVSSTGSWSSNSSVGDLPIQTFTGTGEWTETARWNTGAVPGTTAQVVVDGDAIINSNVEVAGLTINAGKSLTVNAAKQLTISGAATNNGTIIIQSDENGTGTILGNVSGTATVNQYLPGYRTWYLSSPVASATPSGMDRIKYYDETIAKPSDNWVATTTMTKGKGYLVVPVSGNSILFTGTLNSGNVVVDLTRSVTNTDKPGFNLIGNPYPSYLDWTSVYANNNPLGSEIMPTSTMWYRTKVALETDPVTYEYKFWTVNGASGVGSPSTATKYIAPMQSFWVRAKNVGTSTLTFTNAMRKDAPAENKLLKAPAALNTGLQLLRLQVSNESANTDEAVIYFNTNASNGLDAYDSPKMSNENAAIPEIYTSVGNEQLVINGLNAIPLDQEIGLGFVAGNATSFSIKAKDVTNLPSDVKVILKDNVTKAETDLTDGTAVYSFSNIATSGDRFSIIFRTSGAITGIDQPTFSGLTAYSNANNQLTVLYDGAIDAQTVVSVYNAVGQRLVTQSLKGVSTVIDGEFAPGVYVVKVNNLSRKLTIKK